MPHVRCPACHQVTLVRTAMLTTEVECPSCGKTFVAADPLKHQREKSALPVVIGVVVGVLLLGGGAWFFMKSDDPSPESAAKAASVTPVVPEEPVKPKFTATQKDLDLRAATFVRGIESGDAQALTNMVSWPKMHELRAPFDEPDRTPWNVLTSERQVAARKRRIDSIVGDTTTRDFFAAATMDKLTATMLGNGQGRAEVVHQSTTDPALKQRRTLQFVEENGNWFVSDVTTEILRDQPKVVRAPKADTVEDLLKIIVRQDPPAGLAAETGTKIDSAVAKLTDLSLTTEARDARRELVSIGKPAVPALLNVIVDRVELNTHDDRIKVNLVVQTLRDITGQDHPFITDPDAAAGGPRYLENLKLLKNWFTWWSKENKT